METMFLPSAYVVVLCPIPTLDVSSPGYVGRILGGRNREYSVLMQADEPPSDYMKRFGVAPKRKMFVVDIKPEFLAPIDGNPKGSMREIYRARGLGEPDIEKLTAQYEWLKTDL